MGDEVAIIGAGVIGCAIGWDLAKRGAKVAPRITGVSTHAGDQWTERVKQLGLFAGADAIGLSAAHQLIAERNERRRHSWIDQLLSGAGLQSNHLAVPLAPKRAVCTTSRHHFS